ncbi:MAG TPA: hypothetical protein VK742_15045 [Candidatus Sulfotelmatobacter sp.]|jgi:hypothetical protein|nr:hypothetical protein [Candidatus Sulfotelmatobacter sp.]
MTLLETERLVRKIDEILEGGGSSDIAARVADDFAVICHATSLRLQQCESMIKAGDRLQAIQLAETPPCLLDLVTVLEFRNADEWRAYCQKNVLPVAGRIDARAVQELNNCYAQGITTDHPLYAAYRKAVLGRNDEEALKALQSITRLNPNDNNGASELARLDAKVLALKLENLGRLVNEGDPGLVVAAIEAVEAFGFKTKPDGEVWRKAEGIRCAVLLEEAVKLRAASQWVDVLAKLDFIRRLQKEFSPELPPAAWKTVADLEAWGRGEFEKDKSDKEFKSLSGELRSRIEKSEEKDTSARYVELPELKQDSEGLHKAWRSLTGFTRPIPEDLTAAFRKRSGLLDAEISRRTAVRLRLILAGTAVVVIVAGIILWLAATRMKAGDFEKQLRAAVNNQQVHAASQLIDRLKTTDPSLLSVGSLNATMASAETFVTGQNALLDNFNAAFAKLPAKLSGDPDAAQINAIADQLTQVRTTLNALAPDLQPENTPKLKAFEQQWQQYLSEGANIVNGILEQWITSAEAISDQLDYRSTLETASAQLTKLSGDLQKINDCQAGFKGQMTIRSDLIQRAEAVTNKYAAYAGELGKIDEGLTAMKKAASYDEYMAAISNTAASEFSSVPAVVAATAIQTSGLNEESALRALLGAANPATWAFINKQPASGFVPEMAMPAEQTAFRHLLADPAVNASHVHYRLYLDPEKTRKTDWITAGRLDTSEGWKTIPAWTISATATEATFDDHEYGTFSGQMKLSATQPVYQIENIEEPDPTTAFEKAGLNDVYKLTGTYNGPLLPVLDAIKNSHDGSPVFRAYLFCTLVNIMAYQPDAWGLSFSPSIRKAVDKINDVTGGTLSDGDWLIDEKVSKWGPMLEKIFAEDKTTAYAGQAKICLGLDEAVSKDGLRYAGFVGLDGKPVMAQDTPGEMWCYGSGAKEIILFAGNAMPLSPLFALPSSRADYLSRFAVDTNNASLKEALPPMFKSLIR